MDKFFVVGLGGSGGKTLQFLMNVLSQELRRAGWQQPLPSCWQFVHVDLPPAPDGVGPEFPPTVLDYPDGVGTYIRVTNSSDSYASLDITLEQRLARQPDGSSLRALAAWRPSRTQVHIPIQHGAGQYRAVGRIATLAHAPEIFDRLRQAADRLNSNEATAVQQRLGQVLGSGAGEQHAPPMVLVISSLAGGTGASMTLDICNLLRAIPNFPGADSVALLYTPEVFAGLREHERSGVEANALATASELLAALGNHATPWTEADWAVYGGAGGSPQQPGRGPYRVIPVGAKSSGVSFGDGSANTVYEGTARALAAMMMSPVQTNDFRAYTHTNFMTSMAGVGDKFGLDIDPGGGQAQVFGFLSIGFGSIGLGRDRYAEYAAQRIARSAVDHLVTGYRDERIGRNELTEKQVLEERVNYSYRDFIRWTGLPLVRNLEADGRQSIGQLTESLWPRADQDGFSSRMVEEMVASLRGAEGSGSYFATAISTAAQNGQGALLSRTEERITAAAERWVPHLQAVVERATIRIIGEYGVAVAAGVLDHFAVDLIAGADTMRGAGTAPAAQEELNQDFVRLNAVTQKVRASYGQVEQFLSRLRSLYLSFGRDRVIMAAAELLRQLAIGVVRPLASSLHDLNGQLLRQLAESSDGTVAATVQTDSVALWPTAGPVPRRFATATNEVLLEDINSYGELFQRHVVADTGNPQVSPEDAVLTAAAAVITLVDAPDRAAGALYSVTGLEGIATIDGVEVPVRLGRTRSWWPSMLASRSPAQAAYRPTLEPLNLLDTARRWIARPNTSFGTFISEGLRSHLTDPSIGGQDLKDRQDLFVQKFGDALRLARPLANYDQSQLQALHNPAALELTVQLTEVPLGGTALEPRIRQLLLDFPNVNQNALNQSFQSMFTTSMQRNRVDIIDANPPLSPLALSSLQQPIRSRWQSAQPDETARTSFWQWRRSRGLLDFVPVLPSWLEAMVLGWMVGRLVGDVTIPKESDLPSARVYDAAALTWRAFPNPLLGLPWQASVDAWTLLAAVLESMPLAMARCSGDPLFSDLQAYRALRDASQRAGRNTVASLDSWVRSGVGAAGAPSPFVNAATAEARVAAAAEWATTVGKQFRTLLPKSDLRYLPGSELAELTVHNFDAVKAPTSWELAPVIVTAADRLIAELADPAYLGRGSVDPTQTLPG